MAAKPRKPLAPPPPLQAQRSALPVKAGIAFLVVVALGWAGYTFLYLDWRADRALESARQASREFEYDTARDHLQTLLHFRPKSAEGYFLLARIGRQSDDLAAARKHLAEAKKLGWPRDDLELEEHLIEAQESGPRGENEKALQALVLARHPAERVVLEALAKGYVNAHLPVAAEKWLTIWIGRFPEDWLPHLLRGEIMAGFNSAAEARGEYLRVLELRPSYPAALRRLGQLELNANRNPEAAAGYFAALLEVRPDDPDGLFGQAECRRIGGDAAGARGSLDRLLARDPDHSLGRLVYAELDADAGRSEEALASALRAAVSLPDEPEYHYRLGILFNRFGKSEEAALHSARSAQLTELYRKTSEWTAQLLQDPTNADLRCLIGEELLRLDRYETGVAWLSSALLEKPDHRPSHRALAAYYLKIGDAGRADSHRRLAEAKQ